MLCEVEEEEIIKDYMISKECLKEKFREIKENYPNIDLNIVIPHETYIINVMILFYKSIGNVSNYMDCIGLSLSDRIKLKNKLIKE